MSSEFYRAFEDKFRGEREDIKARLKVYLPFLQVLKDIYPDAEVIDLGCGRGEWLELLRENGFSAQGVDLDSGMLSVGQGLGLNVHKGDAISFLKNLTDESQLVVSGFHLAEHIPFDDLQVLVKESLRVLRPAGLLILETPNPENIVVGTSSFYLDPTHNKPIPPELLRFLPEYYGFEKVKILRLQESLNLADKEKLNLLNVLNGVSPDYAVVAQKNADNKLLNLTREAFEFEYGVTLEQLTMTFSEQNDQAEEYSQWLKNEWESTRVRLEGLASEHAIARCNVEQLNTQLDEKKDALLCSEIALVERTEKADNLQTELMETKSKVDELMQSSHDWNIAANQLDEELKSVYASKSWRIMLHFRQLMHGSKRLFLLPISIMRRFIRPSKGIIHNFLAKLIRYILNRPQLHSKIILGLNRYPGIKLKLITLINNNGLKSVLHAADVDSEEKKSVQYIEDDHPNDNFGNEKHIIQARVPDGVNNDKKSPLEKWFY